MSWLRKLYPFNAEQTVNIMSEFGPLVAMFIMNAAYGINVGTWALIITTGIAIVTMLMVLGRLPMFPLIASSVTIVFGFLTIITGDPMWVQIKVTIFNAMFAVFLFGGLYFNRNFFQYIFEKTFNYTKEGWDKFTWSFAWFFVFTAIANEVVRLTFEKSTIYQFPLGIEMDGVNVWILFKIALIMPLSGLYAWWLTLMMQKHRIDDDEASATNTAPAKGGQSASKSAAKPVVTQPHIS